MESERGRRTGAGTGQRVWTGARHTSSVSYKHISLVSYMYHDLLLLCCCFTSTVNIYGHVGTVSSPNHTFSEQA